MNSIIYRLIIKRRVNAAIYPKHYIRDAELYYFPSSNLNIIVYQYVTMTR